MCTRCKVLKTATKTPTHDLIL